jgi:hypothetical protein
MNIKHVLLIPIDPKGVCHPDTLKRDSQYLGISFKSVLAASILDGYTDEINAISEVYQIAYDNFYTHASSNVPFTEEEVASYIYALSELAWYYINGQLPGVFDIPKPDFIHVSDLPDYSFSVEFIYDDKERTLCNL